MCLIIQGKPKHFTKEIIRKAFNGNPHGFGLMALISVVSIIVGLLLLSKTA